MISVGVLAAGETASKHINVEIDESGILYIAGSYGNGCDSFSYVIVRSGWIETGYELGIPDSNECYASQTAIRDDRTECEAAAQAFGLYMEGNDINSDIMPKGCYEQYNEVFYNIHATGGALLDRIPICKRTHTLLFRQTIASKLWAKDELEVNPEDPDNDNYAILNELEDFRSNDGRFYFRLNWPNANDDVSMEWSQTSNPLLEDAAGYEEIDVTYSGRGWGGLEPSGNTALMDGSVLDNYKSNWFYAIGSDTYWGGGIPAYAKADNDNNYAQDQVELYVQKKTDASCYVQTSNYYLSGYPASSTKCNPGSCTFGEAKAYCDTLSDCGGITLDKDGLYTVRVGTTGLQASPTGETSWLKSECDRVPVCVDIDTDYQGNDISYLVAIPSATACRAACALESSCDYYTYSPSREQCWLKISDAGLETQEDRISGPRSCDDRVVRRQLEKKENSTLKNRLINLQN